MGNYSKFIGSLVGGVLGLIGSKFALPAEWQSPEMVSAITLVLGSIFTFIFPPNKAGN